jgi:hypothetical protein
MAASGSGSSPLRSPPSFSIWHREAERDLQQPLARWDEGLCAALLTCSIPTRARGRRVGSAVDPWGVGRMLGRHVHADPSYKWGRGVTGVCGLWPGGSRVSLGGSFKLTRFCKGEGVFGGDSGRSLRGDLGGRGRAGACPQGEKERRTAWRVVGGAILSLPPHPGPLPRGERGALEARASCVGGGDGDGEPEGGQSPGVWTAMMLWSLRKSSKRTVVECGVPRMTAIWPGPVRLRKGVEG